MRPVLPKFPQPNEKLNKNAGLTIFLPSIIEIIMVGFYQSALHTTQLPGAETFPNTLHVTKISLNSPSKAASYP
jgi:hypothetical protein